MFGCGLLNPPTYSGLPGAADFVGGAAGAAAAVGSAGLAGSAGAAGATDWLVASSTVSGGTTPCVETPGCGSPLRKVQKFTGKPVLRSVARVPLIQCRSQASGSFSPMNSVCAAPSVTSS